ncbi:MAG TPA: folate-binding protein YgfZ [Rhodocyclaceae bacterium]|nr:folate-binding protein YgfZ [Rhodocyclaceae bacterium]
MNQEWIDFLNRQGLSSDARNFGNPVEELRNTQAATTLTPLNDIGLIRASGPDAAVFLHNLLTNDIEGLTRDSVRRCGMCTPKGRLLASMLVWHDGDDLLVALAADIHAALLKKLSMYVLRAKVKLTDASDARVLLGLSGPQAAAALGELGSIPATAMQITQIQAPQGQIVRLGEMRFLLALDSAAAPAIWEKLATQASPAGLDAWHWLEIITGLPQITAATQEAFIPQMINFEVAAVGGVSFKKGCYPGQEIVARTQYLGKVKRRMYRAHIESATSLPLAGAHLYAPETGEQPCGQVVNAAPAPGGGFELLAVLQTTCTEGGELHLDNPAGPRLILQPLPYTV